MPRAEPLIKNGPNGVSNRRQKITIDGHTATRGYFQHLRRQSLKDKFKAKAEAKRLVTEAAASSRVYYCDYKRAEMVELEEGEALAAWAAAAAKVSGGPIKVKESEEGKRPVAAWMETTTLPFRPAAR